MQKFDIPERVTDIADGLLKYCTAVTEIRLPRNVTTIGREAFGGCTRISFVVLSENVTKIEDNAFRDVTASVYYPYGCKVAPMFGGMLGGNYGGNLKWFRM